MLEVRDLTKHYGPITALDGATFTAERGRLVGFLGPNGAGKTTTMRCVFGLVEPERGEVRWKGAPVGASERLRFGYMPEQRGLYPRMRVADQLTYFAEQHGIARRTARASSLEWLGRLGLGDRANAKLEDLSHGNQQRVQLAAALVHDPELLVLDEPFSGLDPIGIATLSDVLRERAQAGVGIVFSSHQLDLVEDLCEDVVIISRGRVVAQGAIESLRRASSRRHLDIEVRGANGAGGTDGAWLPPDLDGISVVSRADGRVRLLVDEGIDLDALLRRALSAGEVVRFSYEPPRLSELFMEAVGEGDTPAAGGPAR
jgi:ABC-2 type transport system ATP-binding protein